MRQNYFILFLFLVTFLKGASQDQIEDVKVNTQFWLDYNIKYDLEEFKTISGFFGYRSITPHIYNNVLAVATYNITNQKGLKFLNLDEPLIHSFHLGARTNYINNKNSKDDFEFRLMQGAKFYLPSIKAIPLLNYIRFEERFQKTFDHSNWNIGFRFRYKISTIIKWNNRLFDFTKGLYVPLNVEFFFNLKKVDRFNDVIRISPGIGYKLNEDWKFEMYVSYQNTTNTSINGNTSNDFVLRLRVFNSSTKKTNTHKNEDEQIKELIE